MCVQPVSDALDSYEDLIEGNLKKYIGKTCKIKVDDKLVYKRNRLFRTLYTSYMY